jgi:hypothetical protein
MTARIVERQQRERRSFARPMARCASRVEQRRDIFAERDRTVGETARTEHEQ